MFLLKSHLHPLARITWPGILITTPRHPAQPKDFLSQMDLAIRSYKKTHLSMGRKAGLPGFRLPGCPCSSGWLTTGKAPLTARAAMISNTGVIPSLSIRMARFNRSSMLLIGRLPGRTKIDKKSRVRKNAALIRLEKFKSPNATFRLLPASAQTLECVEVGRIQRVLDGIFHCR